MNASGGCAVADFQASKQRKSAVLEALFEILFRVLKHAAGGPARQQQQNGGTDAVNAGVPCAWSSLLVLSGQ